MVKRHCGSNAGAAVEHLHLAEIAGWEVEVRKEQQEMKKTVGQCRLCCPQPVGEVQQLVDEAG